MRTGLRINNKTILINWYENDLLDTNIPLLFAAWNGGVTAPDHEIHIRRSDDGCILELPDSTQKCHDEKELLSHLEYALTLLSQDCFSDHMQIHASCIDHDGSGALFVASHGHGKTTLALTAIASGMKALTDDVAVIDPDLHHVKGFPRPFKASDFTFNMDPTVIPSDCPYVTVFDDLTYVFFYAAENPYYVETTRLKHIFFPVRRDGATEIMEMGETEAMRNILMQGFNYYDRRDVCVADLLSLLRTAPPLKIAFSNHWDAIEKVRDLLEN